MKRLLFVVCSAIAIASGASAAENAALPAVPPVQQPQTYPSPQEAAPNIYTKLFENDRVIVSEIKFAPGDKAPMHTHAYDHAVYVIEPGQLTISKPDGTSMVKDAKAGEVIWMGLESHEAVNTGTTTLRATVTEFKG